MDDAPQIFRGSVNGAEKYCRILIRRKRAPLQVAIDYFRDAIVDGDNIIEEYTAEEQSYLRAQQACFVTALVAMEAAMRANLNGVAQWPGKERRNEPTG